MYVQRARGDATGPDPDGPYYTAQRSWMGWLRLVGSLKLQVSFAEHSLFYRALLQKRPIILRSLLIVATPYVHLHTYPRPIIDMEVLSSLNMSTSLDSHQGTIIFKD